MRQVLLAGKYYKIQGDIIKRAISPWMAKVSAGSREYSDFSQAQLAEFHDFRNGIGLESELPAESNRLWFTEGIDFTTPRSAVLGPLVNTAGEFDNTPIKIIDFQSGTYALCKDFIAKWSGTAWVVKAYSQTDLIDAIVVTDQDDEYLVISSATAAQYSTAGESFTALTTVRGYLAFYATKLWGITTDGGTLYYSAANDIRDAGGSHALSGQFGTIYDLFEGKLLADGTPILYMVGTEGLFTIDVTNWIAYKQEVEYPPLSHSGHVGKYWNANVWLGTGYGILKVTPSMATLIGPDQDDGLPSGYQGSIFDMVTVNNWLAYCVNGTAGSSTETLRPNAAGSEESIADETGNGAGDHHDLVDDVTPDEATTMVHTLSATYVRDLYNIPASSGSGPINKITVYFRVRNTNAASHTYAKASIKSDSTVTDGTERDHYGDTWATYSQDWAVNPADDEAWEWADIDALEIGVSLKANVTWQGECTQVYVVVSYTAAAVKSSILKRNSSYGGNLQVYTSGSGKSITCLHHSPSSLYTNGRLWFGEGTDVKYMMFPDTTSNVKQISTYEYVDDSGYGYLPIFRKLAAITKVALGVAAITKSCDSSEYVELWYRLNDTGDWVDLGDFNDSPRDDILTFGDGLGAEFYTIQFRIKLIRGGTDTNSPELESLLFYYMPRPAIINAWTFNILCIEDNAEDIIAEIEAIRDTKKLVVFNPTGDELKTGDNYNVALTTMPLKFYVENQGTREGMIQVDVQQIFEG